MEGKKYAVCPTPPAARTLFSCFEYKGNVRECIRRSKYNSMEFDALKDLTTAGLHYAWRAGIFYEGMFIVPAPLGRNRIKTRGFNQAEVIARKVSDFYKLDLATLGLKRGKETAPLAELGRAERLEEMKEAFIADPKLVAGRRILLVDDVCTTGATLISCSRVLLPAGSR